MYKKIDDGQRLISKTTNIIFTLTEASQDEVTSVLFLQHTHVTASSWAGNVSSMLPYSTL